MSNYTKFIIARVLCISLMRGAISMLYLTRRGLDPSVAVWLFAYYGIAIVLLEYPTGVIGDTYGHKSSVVLGGLFSAIGIGLITFQLPREGYMIGLTLHAIGMSLFSGSTDALLKHIVGDSFKKKFPQVQAIATTARGISAVLGGYIFLYNPVYAVTLPAFMSLTGALVFMTIPYTYQYTHGANIYETAIRGARHIFSSKTLIGLLIVFTFLLGFRYSIKTLVTVMGEYFTIAIPLLTWVVGGQFLVRAIANLTVHYISRNHSIFLSLTGFLLLTLIPIHNPYIILGGYILIGYFLTVAVTHIKIYITENTDISILATVLSTFSLGWRLSGSTLIFIAGYTLKFYSYQTMLNCISGVVVIGICMYLIISKPWKRMHIDTPN